MNIPLKPKDVIDNAQLREIFKCSPQGGMRRSHKTNTLVLISNHVGSIYADRWIDEVLHYTGMGQSGDQELDATQNKTLNESQTNGVEVHLFEVFVDKEYTYVGQVQLTESPYQETQPDKDGEGRRVWVFPLRLLSGAPTVLDEPSYRAEAERRAKKAARLSDNELKNMIAKTRRKTGTRKTHAIQYDRDPYIAEWAKRRSGGICQLCDQSAPFLNSKGEPYLESHHIIWLSKGGDDTIENTVALCPNCHRKMHVVNASEDREKLIAGNLGQTD